MTPERVIIAWLLCGFATAHLAQRICIAHPADDPRDDWHPFVVWLCALCGPIGLLTIIGTAIEYAIQSKGDDDK